MLIMMRETLMAVLIHTLAEEGRVGAVGHCPSSLLESVVWCWRRQPRGRKGRRRLGCRGVVGGGGKGCMAADTLESLETFSGFQKVETSVNGELLSQGVKGAFNVQRDSHNHRPQCGKKATQAS